MLKLLHVNCKHCGKSVEVADLLASAEQPCPSCGKPLLDDQAPVNDQTIHATRSTGAWAQRLNRWTRPLQKLSDWWNGTGVLIRRDEAMLPPPKVCIVCGAPATHVVQVAAEIQGIYLGTPQFLHMLAPYCEKHYRVSRSGVAVGLVIFLILLAALVVSWLRPYFREEWGVSINPIAVLIAMFVGCVATLLLWQYWFGGVYFLAHGDEYIEAQSACPEYIRALEELRATRLEKLP
jgi:hypothetical protein